MTSERLMHQLREILSSISNDRSQSNVGVAAALAKLILELGVSDKVSRFSILLIELVKAIIREVEKPVRKMLADELASDSRASRGIVRALAEDDIDVAWPILLRSNSLEDTDLIEIAIKGSIRHRLAIAQRELVEEVVSAAVMAFGEPEVAKSLLANAGARISERTFVRMAELAKEWGDMQPSLAARPDLPAAIALEMLEWAIDGVHEKLYAAIGGDKAKLRRIVLSALDGERIAADLDLEHAARRAARPEGTRGQRISVGTVEDRARHGAQRLARTIRGAVPCRRHFQADVRKHLRPAGPGEPFRAFGLAAAGDEGFPVDERFAGPDGGVLGCSQVVSRIGHTVSRRCNYFASSQNAKGILDLRTRWA